MKKQLYLLLFLCTSTLLTAQSGLRVGAHNGLHFSTLQFSGSNALNLNNTTQPLLGYRVGMSFSQKSVNRDFLFVYLYIVNLGR
jgi:hypothetical protein